MPAARETQLTYMREMMQRLGLDPAESVLPHSSLGYLTALRRCAACPSKKRCRKWLDRAPKDMAFAPSFCPNADIFFELQFDHLGRAYTGAKGP
jgi:Family of unknown function (DUF6455)